MRSKVAIAVLLLTLTANAAWAQQMSDEKVIEYVLDARAKGQQDMDIVRTLMKKGVTMDQINRIRQKADRQQKTGQGATLDEKTRTRTPIENDKRITLADDGKKKQTQDEKEQEMYDNMGFLLPDTMAWYKEWQAEKQKKVIFGHDMFQDKELGFEAAYNLPTPENYRLGAGDEVIIDIWGASQNTLQETISPDGYIQVENIGPVYLSGLTVKQANQRLKDTFGRIYSGLYGEAPDSNIRLSLGQNRSIQVHVMGEVENPGSYAMSSFATIFNALYMAGGVRETGTLRAVKVYRNNKEIASCDIYDFLLHGKMNTDIRLEDNDAVLVGSYAELVCVAGKVKRPMYYEMLATENVKDVLDYAGGFAGNAYRKDVRLVRVGQREMEIYTLDEQEQRSFRVMDGDSITVDSVLATFANMVEVKGAVYRPGQFQMNGRINTVRQLIENAGGLKDDAFLNRAVLNRRNADGTMENLSVNLAGLMDGSASDIVLRKNDCLFVASIEDMRETQVITIYGEVAFPGTYHYQDNMTIEDFIVNAGGLTEAASTAKVDVSRRIKDSHAITTSDTISQTFSFSISDGLVVSGQSAFTLKPFDEVYVRKSPGYYAQETVNVDGEVMFGGTYALTKKNQRLSELVSSAGGLTPQAYATGARLVRQMTDEEKLQLESTIETAIAMAEDKKDSLNIRRRMMNQTSYPVGIELNRALDKPGSDADVVLRAGDRLIIPQFSNTVKVSGEVMYANTIAYKKGKSASYYINQAGGCNNKAKRSKAYVVYMNGTVSKVKGGGKVVQPGCEIVVPEKEEREGLKASEILSLSSTAASLATVVLALINVFK